MTKSIFRFAISIMLGAVLLNLMVLTVANAETWGWKSSETPEDVINFLNGTGLYKQSVKAAKISATFKNGQYDFTIFYQPASGQPEPAKWVWKQSYDPMDVVEFLNGTGAYRYPVVDAKICALVKQDRVEFIVFYRSGNQEQPKGQWQWKLAQDTQDMVKHLAGKSPYQHAVMTARVAAATLGSDVKFYVFFQPNVSTLANPHWADKKSSDPQDVQRFISGQSPYTFTPRVVEICTYTQTGQTEYVVFYNQGPGLIIQSPLADERFVKPEAVSCLVMVTSDLPFKNNLIQWQSNQNGSLGQGQQVIKQNLNLGPHTLTVTGLGESAQVTIRVLADLDALYHAKPSEAEIQRLLNDFNLQWQNGNPPDEQWDAYVNYYFNQQCVYPSKMVLLARLDVLRHQVFSKPLPFTDQGIYQHFKTYVKNIHARLDCELNHAITNGISLSRNASVWDWRRADVCKLPEENPTLAAYVHPLSLCVHEARHLEPNDPGHISGPNWIEPAVNPDTARDAMLKGGSGYAWAALYYMWVYKYGLYDSPAIKQAARQSAKSLLKERFGAEPTYYGNPDVQAVLQELVNEIKQGSKK